MNLKLVHRARPGPPRGPWRQGGL